MNLLIIEDDKEISDMLQAFLKSEGFDAEAAADGKEGIEKFNAGHYDLVLLDLMIPKISGMEVMGKVRETSTVPIIIISAKDTDSDKTLGLGLGADDYITKPFSVTEVLARIKANLRRTTQYAPVPPKEDSVISAGSLTMNTENYSVCKNGVLVELTAKEFEILKLLMLHPQKVYTKEQIYSQIWNDAYMGDENAVNVHISRLRTKIEEDPHKPQIVVTVWGIGYKLGELK